MADVTKYVDEIAAELSSPLLSFERDALASIIRRAQDDARAERSSDGEPRGCPTPGACSCPPAEPTSEPSTEPGEEHPDDMVLFVDAVRHRLGLPEGVTCDQVLDAIRPPARDESAVVPVFAVGDWVTVPIDTKVPNVEVVIQAGTIGEVLHVKNHPQHGEEISVDFFSGERWWMTASTLQKTRRINRAPTYADVLEAAAAAKREIDASWPEWKKAIR